MYYFIVNEKSKSGRTARLWKELKMYLKDNQVEYQVKVPKYEGHATKLTREICEKDKGDIKLVIIGGDGTANEVINGITDFERVSFGIVPMGSGNDFVRGLGFKGKPVRHLKRIVESRGSQRIDLGRVTWNNGEGTRLFAISSGVGMDAIVCKKAEKSKIKNVLNRLGLGKLTYLFITVWTLFSMETVEGSIDYGNGLKKNFSRLIFAAAMNFKAEGGGVSMAPKASAKDGLLSLCSAAGIPKWRTFFVLPVLVAAKHEKLKGIEVKDSAVITIELNKPEVLHADGEYLGDVTMVEFKCEPEKLKIMC